MTEYLQSKGIDMTVVDIAKVTNVKRRTLYNIYDNDKPRFDNIISTIGNKSNYSEDWHEYRQSAMLWRVECDRYEYVSVLLLGVVEEYHNFMEARRMSTCEKQVEIFGRFLWNVAELNNILDECFSVEMSSVYSSIITSPYMCISIVRKHGSANVNKRKLVEKAVCVARGMVVAFTTMNIAQDSMKVSLKQMKESRK
jgi:hypothetical protein